MRRAIGRILCAPDYVIDVCDGPRRIAVRGDDGEIVRYATREDAQDALEAMAADDDGA